MINIETEVEFACPMCGGFNSTEGNHTHRFDSPSASVTIWYNIRCPQCGEIGNITAKPTAAERHFIIEDELREWNG